MSTENTNKSNRLQELKGSGYEIAEGQPDIRGWDVKDSNGRTIGEIDELIFDERSRKVRYLVVELDDDELDLDDDREVLIPIGLAQLHQNDDDVLLPGITTEQLRSLPEYDKDDLGSDIENNIRNIFAGTAGAGAAAFSSGVDDDEFYNHDHFNEDNLYKNRGRDQDSGSIPVIREDVEIGKQEVERGGIRLRSRVVENEVEENVNLRQEEVKVERVSADRAATADDLREDSIEATEKSEVPVVNKQARVVEEVSLNKEVTEREETIRDTARNTEVDVEKIGKNSKTGKDSLLDKDRDDR